MSRLPKTLFSQTGFRSGSEAAILVLRLRRMLSGQQQRFDAGEMIDDEQEGPLTGYILTAMDRDVGFGKPRERFEG